MSFAQIDLYLYQMLNAPDQASNLMKNYAIFVSHDLIFVMLFIFLAFWLRGSFQTKKLILKAFIFSFITLCITESLSMALGTPRPFVLEVGQTLIEHAPTPSFPSNHMAIFSGIAFSYYFSEKRDIGRFLIVLAWLVAWARVYVGVHFPLDMIGSFFIAWAVNYFGLNLWHKYKEPFIELVLRIHFKIFRPLIENGLIK